MNLFRPDKVKIIIGAQSGLEGHVKMVDQRAAVVVVSDLRSGGVNMGMGEHKKANKQEK